MTARPSLPIDALLPAIVERLAVCPNAVLRAPTGSGKTTRLPPALADAPWIGGRAVCVLEPRRLAARAAARRIAFERGVELGAEVGYRVRFDTRASGATRIEVVTEGLFLRMLQEDPALERFGAIVFDEFHERNLASDLALAMVRRVQRELRSGSEDGLRVVVTSATLDVTRLLEFLEPAVLFEAEGRQYPIELRHELPRRGERPASAVARSVRTLLGAARGDVLAFLPGTGEIAAAKSELEGTLGAVDVVELYGDLPPEHQDRALSPGPRRRVVLATNVAETSVTVGGIEVVVDSGLARELRYDAATGLDRLELVRISRASADQRAGRAGREGPGLCLRLWDQRDERSLSEFGEPEVRRVDVAGAYLELVAWGERDPSAFPWFEAPPAAALERARELLERLGALEARPLEHRPPEHRPPGYRDVSARLAARGRAMARLPVHPRLAALLLAGAAAGTARRAALAAALCSERDVFPREPRSFDRHATHARDLRHTDSDVLERLRAIETWERHGAPARVRGLVPAAAQFVLRARDQLAGLAQRSTEPRTAEETRDASSDTRLLRALLAAYPDRVVRSRGPGSDRGVMVGGRGVRLADECTVRDAELFVAVALDAGRRGERAEALVRQASRIERAWLASELVHETTELEFDANRETVMARRSTRYLDLALDETVFPAPPGPETEAALAAAARAQPARALGLDEPGLQRLLARVRALAAWRPELELPAYDEAALAELLPELCVGARSFAELRRAPLQHLVRARLGPHLATLEREAPEHVDLPSGRRAPLVYESGETVRPPVLAARIQELFGWRESPTVAAGRVRVLLHLLAPNQRPQQVTDDLASFWSGAYADVRKELRRRYPKHDWPEDPWTAKASRRPARGGRGSG